MSFKFDRMRRKFYNTSYIKIYFLLHFNVKLEYNDIMIKYKNLTIIRKYNK